AQGAAGLGGGFWCFPILGSNNHRPECDLPVAAMPLPGVGAGTLRTGFPGFEAGRAFARETTEKACRLPTVRVRAFRTGRKAGRQGQIENLSHEPQRGCALTGEVDAQTTVANGDIGGRLGPSSEDKRVKR